MLGEIAKLFSGKSGDRRAHVRKTDKFAVWWLKGETPVTGVGLEISANGAVFVLKEKPPEGEFAVLMQLGERRIQVRLLPARSTVVMQNGASWYHYAAKFTGIAADDWDAIVRYVHDVPEPNSKGADELRVLSMKTDDAYRLLPLTIQMRIIDTLVSFKRLNAPQSGQTPLLKMAYAGATKKSDGSQIHRFHVHSRTNNGEGVEAFDTTFLIDSDGNVNVAAPK